MNWYGLLLPVAYLTVLVGSFATFSYLYRSRKAAKSASLEPWFPTHVQRNIYLSLLHLDPSDADSKPADTEKSLSKVPDGVIKAALMRRAVEDIARLVQIRSSKAALQSLVKQGSVNQELWERFQRAEVEHGEECQDVIAEANALAPNWGNHIFASAEQIYHQQMLKERLADVQGKMDDEREWWTKRQQNIQSDFMKEIDDEEKAADKVEAKKVVTPKIGTTPSKTGASDDEAVIVESGGPTGSQGPQQTASAKKRKKNKK